MSEEQETQELAEKEHAEMEDLASVLDINGGEEEDVAQEMLRSSRLT